MTLNRLPNRRPCRTIKLHVGPFGVYMQTGDYPDGRPGEVVVTVAKAGAMLRGFLESWSFAVSSALQHGEPLASVIDTHKGTRYEPNGEVKGYDGITECTSIPDLAVRVLEAEYP